MSLFSKNLTSDITSSWQFKIITFDARRLLKRDGNILCKIHTLGGQ